MSSPSPAQDHVSRLMQMLAEHWVFTLATHPGDATSPQGAEVPQADPAPPHCAPLFYALDGDEASGPALIFTSSPTSMHSQHIASGPTAVGGAIYLESETVGELRGAQLRGEALQLEPGSDAEAAAKAVYLKRHPIAEGVLSEGRHRIYRLRVRWAKLTDNRLGYGQHPIVEFE